MSGNYSQIHLLEVDYLGVKQRGSAMQYKLQEYARILNFLTLQKVSNLSMFDPTTLHRQRLEASAPSEVWTVPISHLMLMTQRTWESLLFSLLLRQVNVLDRNYYSRVYTFVNVDN
ncbi:MAG: hypothetical protein AUJ28_00630 [Parcubacteria group bacterium CG1_02_37_51]|uniref:Uncharacterized protein n=2 Tax=Candidatus Komeiliibacteriota TaxID=1817908 RepID=A0A2M8DSK2_9BACT|nr:MAG: hypothetical protein AUJ28_00630 [Parcubacteria group bacterium CG1_02_37_51]PIY94933.1 MAG: hypothetical protein COY67_01740 [Candidatus Komeilibacteria bacterium CG_4_10_14_0_8_um_filter_37_78]PJC02326.1 MAG: hypothetical protein CO073_00085 [Candidatus Komeilibacteria bacterium CG_4_9_14_0_8_um_filter_36_9]